MTTELKKLETYPFIVDQAKMIEHMGVCGLRPAMAHEIPELVALGERLINDQIADAAVVEHVHNVTGVTAWACGVSPLEGMLLCVPLSEAGLAAVQTNTFSPGAPNEDHLAAVGTTCAAIYVGIYAGATHAARKAVMVASGMVRVSVFGSVPCFARAATDDGARSMVSLGFAPAGFGAEKLWVQGPLEIPQLKVA